MNIWAVRTSCDFIDHLRSIFNFQALIHICLLNAYMLWKIRLYVAMNILGSSDLQSMAFFAAD